MPADTSLDPDLYPTNPPCTGGQSASGQGTCTVTCAACTCGYARVHFTPDCPAWGILTVYQSLI